MHGVPGIDDIIAEDQRSPKKPIISELVLHSVYRVQFGAYVPIASICLDFH